VQFLSSANGRHTIQRDPNLRSYIRLPERFDAQNSWQYYAKTILRPDSRGTAASTGGDVSCNRSETAARKPPVQGRGLLDLTKLPIGVPETSSASIESMLTPCRQGKVLQ
jgi:hypothetical protein